MSKWFVKRKNYGMYQGFERYHDEINLYSYFKGNCTDVSPYTIMASSVLDNDKKTNLKCLWYKNTF